MKDENKRNKRNNSDSCNKSNGRKPRSRKPKEVEVNIDRNDINKADLPVSDKGYTTDSKERRSKDKNRKEFWNHYPELVRDAASITLAYPLGTPIQYNDMNTSIARVMDTIPGICRLRTMITIGQPIGVATDPINTAANKLYTFVRRNVSTYANYDSPDLMMYLIAMDSIYATYAWAARIYGIANVYKVYNRYYPVEILGSMGVDYNSILQNLADFRYGLNNIAFKMAQFCVPAGYALFQRHIEMYGTLYLDSNTVKAQTYYYDLDGYYQYEEVTAGPAKLKYYSMGGTTPSSFLKYQQILTKLNSMLNAIMNSQDCIAMSGDVLRAFGSDKVYTVSPIAENYFVEPVFSAEMLSQMENAIALGNTAAASSGYIADIVQSTNLASGANLMQQLAFSQTPISDLQRSQNAFLSNLIINFHLDNVTPDDVMVASRLMVNGGSINKVPNVNPTDVVYVPEIVGTEVLLGVAISRYNANGTINTTQYSSPIANTVTAGNVIPWAVCDWAPRFRFVTSSQQGELMDYDNYGILNSTDTYNLHQTAWMSALANDDIVMLGRKPVNK